MFGQLQLIRECTNTRDSSSRKSRTMDLLYVFCFRVIRSQEFYRQIRNLLQLENACFQLLPHGCNKVAALQADFDIERETFQAQMGTQIGVCSKTEMALQTSCIVTSAQCHFCAMWHTVHTLHR